MDRVAYVPANNQDWFGDALPKNKNPCTSWTLANVIAVKAMIRCNLLE